MQMENSATWARGGRKGEEVGVEGEKEERYDERREREERGGKN